jgi:voltage-gated potassium channel Kch
MKKPKKNAAEYSSRVTGGVPAKLSFWKKLKRWFGDYKWPFIGFMWVVAIALGYLGFSKYFFAIGETRSSWDTFYRTLQLLILESGFVSGPVGWELQLARFLAPAMAAYTVIQALAIIFKEQLQLFRVRFLKDHIVICGLGQKGLLLSGGFREREEQVVVIEQDEDNGLLGQCREQGAIILIGNAADPVLLRKARVNKAKYVISVCGDDGANAEVAVHARELVWDRKGKALSCLIHISDFQLCNLLREREIRLGKLDAFRLELFNVFESGARILLDEYPPFSKTGEDYSSRPHLVVVGIGRMGESLVVNAARNWWDRDRKSSERLRITFIDREAGKKKESLCLRYPQLERVCELVPVEVDIQVPEFERADFLFDDQGRCDVTTVYVCLDDDSNALGAAFMIRQQVRALEIPIVIRMTQDAGLATLLRCEEDKPEGFANLHAFGLFDHTCTPDLISRCTYEILARAIHEDYVRSERAKGHTPETNPSAVPWGELEETYKKSNRRAAEHIRVKLDAIGCDIVITTDWDTPRFEFTPEEVELLGQMEHERWVEEKLSDGWRYSPTKDLEKKTIPYLVPWDELSEADKNKDRNQVRNLPAFLAKARFEIYRTRKKE